jgi:hypothetical protein
MFGFVGSRMHFLKARCARGRKEIRVADEKANKAFLAFLLLERELFRGLAE